ncbi:amidohydrolase family protein [Brevibacterium sp. 91QC2O2]|uniref:metal-dependent hydrolase family protein n=1 Tax=Brevibacterium sp. 91QC2O2 TaxID=2968458 RepID=UPI00211D0B9B|nr:amidohydrolase family protein [Brevibacterium sp. 91QC2O2]MCQ9368728.1 amidohydrolase family protein [Brevibacterium sp. 91QC2O2]
MPTDHPVQIFTGAQVFDGHTFLGAQDVVVTNGTITSVVPAGTAVAAETTQGSPTPTVVDAVGKTLTPGIIDTHVHVKMWDAGSLMKYAEPFSYPFYKSVVNLKATLHGGVTFARDAGHADAGLRLALERGDIEGPKLRLAITVMSQTGGHGDSLTPSGVPGPNSLSYPGKPDSVADGIDGVRKKTREILRAGADQIKICSTGGVMSPSDDPRHSQFTYDEIRTIVEEAEAQGTYVMAHAQGTQGINNALRAGVRSIEHGIYLDESTIELFLANDAYLVPTLQAPLAVIKNADAGMPISPVAVAKARTVAQIHAEAVARAYEAGVKIAMGTDAGVGPHGQNLEEIELMAGVGMSIEDALTASTATAAELMHIEDRVGRIAPGLAADIVLFDGDLSQVGVGDIRQRVAAVYQDGIQRR